MESSLLDSKWPLYTLSKYAWHYNDILKIPKFKINLVFQIQNLQFLFKKKAISIIENYDMYLMKIHTSFVCLKKNSDLYLMKIQICFCFEKNFKKIFKSISNENTNLFLFWKNFRKNFRSVLNENTDLFLFRKNFQKLQKKF